MAVVQVDRDGGVGFLPQESLGAGAQIEQQGTTSHITPIFQMRTPRSKADPQLILSITAQAQGFSNQKNSEPQKNLGARERQMAYVSATFPLVDCLGNG